MFGGQELSFGPNVGSHGTPDGLDAVVVHGDCGVFVDHADHDQGSEFLVETGDGAATPSGDPAALPPSVTAAEVASLELRLGFPLHPELRTLLHQYDGRHDPLGGEDKRVQAEFLPFGLHLIDAAGIRDLAEEAKEDYPADPAAYPGMTEADEAEAHIGSWVPFAADHDRGIAFVDHRPGPTYGDVYVFAEASGGWPPLEIARGLTDLFDGLAGPSEPAEAGP
ncbi:SMI1/KNR4 family protein [Uniformispora flossi]|uniref:SMI1/KNR4 family protein n=1 Tax=Uniformispora flossi TaxID=3390723 RepID=UPI003C301C62